MHHVETRKANLCNKSRIVCLCVCVSVSHSTTNSFEQIGIKLSPEHSIGDLALHSKVAVCSLQNESQRVNSFKPKGVKRSGSLAVLA